MLFPLDNPPKVKELMYEYLKYVYDYVFEKNAHKTARELGINERTIRRKILGQT